MTPESEEWSYADIKASVLVEYDNSSMICEVQFLMDWMIKSKKKGHAIYEITRNKVFVENVAKLSRLYSGKEEEACALATRGQTDDLSDFMVRNPSLKFEGPEGEASLIHTVAEFGNREMLKLILSSLVSEEGYDGTFKKLTPSQQKLITCKGEDNETLVICAARGGNAKIVQVELIYMLSFSSPTLCACSQTVLIGKRLPRRCAR